MTEDISFTRRNYVLSPSNFLSNGLDLLQEGNIFCLVYHMTYCMDINFNSSFFSLPAYIIAFFCLCKETFTFNSRAKPPSLLLYYLYTYIYIYKEYLVGLSIVFFFSFLNMKDHLHPKKEQHCLTKKRRESNRPANKHEINEMTYNRTEIYLQTTSPTLPTFYMYKLN